MSLNWQTSKPSTDPFDESVGDTTTYQVHFTKSEADESAEIDIVIADVVKKALSFFQANKGERAKRLLFLWDVVYATLTVVYTDDSMMYDAHHVAKCYFVNIDKQGTGEQVSDQFFQTIKSCITQYANDVIPEAMPVVFSDQDRASVGEKHFQVRHLTTGCSGCV